MQFDREFQMTAEVRARARQGPASSVLPIWTWDCRSISMMMNLVMKQTTKMSLYLVKLEFNLLRIKMILVQYARM